MDRPARHHLLVLAAYLVLALIMTWPVIACLDRYIISEYMDTSTAFYNIWWFHQAICELQTWPWTNTLINYPYDFSMAMFPMWVPYDTLALPILEIKDAHGLPHALNMIIIVGFVLRGYVTFVFVRYLVNKSLPAFIMGTIVAFCPFVFWNVTRVHASCLELVILVVYFFLRALREQGWKPAAGLVAAACLLLYTSPSYTADMVLFLPLLGLYVAMRERETVVNKKTFTRLAVVAVLTVLICSPFLYHVVSEMIKNPAPIAQPHDLRVQYSANLIGFISPGWDLKAYAWLSQFTPYPDADLQRNHGIAGYEIFMGYVFLGAVIYGAVRYFRHSFIYLVLAMVFIVFSLGPSLHVGNHTFSATMPYDYFQALFPWLRFERTPVRHVGPALVALTVPAAFALDRLFQALSARRARLVFGVLLLAVLFEFNQSPLKLDSFPVPDFVFKIKADPQHGSVLDLPQVPDIKRLGGYYHMHHNKPLVFRLTSRGMDPKVQESALFRYTSHPRVWLQLSGKERDRAVKELVGELCERDVRYIVAYPRFMGEEDYKGLRSMVAELRPAKVLVDNESFFVCRFERWSGKEVD